MSVETILGVNLSLRNMNCPFAFIYKQKASQGVCLTSYICILNYFTDNCCQSRRNDVYVY